MNTDVPDDLFEDLGNVFAKLVFGFVWLTHLLGLHDLVNAGRRVSRRMLDRLQLTSYQAASEKVASCYLSIISPYFDYFVII